VLDQKKIYKNSKTRGGFLEIRKKPRNNNKQQAEEERNETKRARWLWAKSLAKFICITDKLFN